MRQDLIDFFMWFRDYGEHYIGLTVEELVDIFIENYLER